MTARKFRKRPVVIEAFQMTEERRWDNSDWPGWLHQAWQDSILYCIGGGAQLYIKTLEGEHKVSWGDWIIQGVKGELYPCKPDIFEATYEEAHSDD